jgi:23S rRNA-/tRNA-specific pseudouridylate synthase
MAPHGLNARPAQTTYTSLVYYKDATLLAVSISTGRTHQIRVHCSSIGHPVIGDATYGTPSNLIKRQALHAWKLEFTYKNIHYNYRVPVPLDFKQILTQLRRA